MEKEAELKLRPTTIISTLLNRRKDGAKRPKAIGAVESIQ
jgi:hypothetical protein